MRNKTKTKTKKKPKQRKKTNYSQLLQKRTNLEMQLYK